MQFQLKNVAVAFGVGLATTLFFGLLPTTDNVSPVFCKAEAQAKNWKSFGASTCGGSSCHAASGLGEKRPSTEYVTWQQKDAHSKAYNKLFDELSTDMAKEMGIKDASKDQKCLVCHSTNVPKAQHGDKYNLEDGVSCDACHGPAEGWFKVHAKPHKYEDMLKLGMLDTRDMYVRATMCVGCHLQISNELLEAGHPDLSFELFGHSRRETPHWYERQTWDGARAWIVGSAVSVAESLKKLNKRIKEKPGEDALNDTAAQATGYLNVLRHAFDVYGDDKEKAFCKKLDEVLNGEKIGTPEVSKMCEIGVKNMQSFAKKMSATDKFTKDNIKMLWSKIVNDSENLDGIDEYGAEQVAGAVYALYNSIKTGKGPRLKTDIETPKAIDNVLVRPTMGLPESLFNDDFEFQSKAWLKRFAEVKKLVK